MHDYHQMKLKLLFKRDYILNPLPTLSCNNTGLDQLRHKENYFMEDTWFLCSYIHMHYKVINGLLYDMCIQDYLEYEHRNDILNNPE